MSKVSIEGLNKADVLAALYNASKPQGMGFMHYDPKPMTSQEAGSLLLKTTHFDYLKGRVMKVELSSDVEFDAWGYDRDNGENAAAGAVNELRQTGQTVTPTIKAVHHENTLAAAREAKGMLHTKSRIDGNSMSLGLADVADVLGPRIEQAIRKS